MDIPKETFSESFSYLFNNYVIYILLFTIFYILIHILYIHYTCAPDKLITEFKNFKSFRTNHYSQSKPEIENIDKSKNSHFLVYGASGSGKTNFIKWYLNTLKLDYIVFGKDSTEWPEDKFINHNQLDQINLEKINNKTIILDDLGSYKNLKSIVDDLFRYGRHNNLQIIYLAHYAKDVLPVIRETIKKINITLDNSDKFFESIVDAYSLSKCIIEKWIEYRNQNEYGIIELNTRTKHYII